tara:strand:+ start:43 stop:288 length:246 start_codon:yes stop_codon:yes gene_type:complete
MLKNKTMNVEVAVDKIVKGLHHQMYDIIFQAVCDEMNEFYVFQEETYLTDKGMDMFQEQWFEFYHEHHGDIMHQLMNKITN